MSLYTALHRRPDQIVEQERAVHKQRESKHLQPLEGLPAKTKRYNPNEEGSASIDGRAGRRRDGACHTQTEEVEAAVAISISTLDSRN